MSIAQPRVPAGFRDPDGPTSEDLVRCVRCGLCLSSCPTYQELGLETDSPRGRIHLMRAIGDGRLEFTDSVELHLNRCLVCRACETVCPSGVPFGRMMEATRTVMARRKPETSPAGRIQRFAFRRLLPSQPLLRLVATSMRFYQRSGLRSLVNRIGLTRFAPGLARLDPLMPTVPDRFYRRPANGVASAEGEPRGRVALFVGCVMPVLFGPTQQDTQDVLTANGFDVVVPEVQTCCGALQAHGGDRGTARELAKRNIAAFETSGASTIVINSAGCGSLLKEYGELLAEETGWADRAHRFAESVRDISEVLAGIELRGPLGELPMTVTYQDACHLAHGQGVRKEPRQVLRAIPGLKLVELPASDRCCGSAGIYNLVQPEIAGSLGARKVTDIEKTGATVVVAGNPGCLLQMSAGLRERGLAVETIHTVSLLAESYRRGRLTTEAQREHGGTRS